MAAVSTIKQNRVVVFLNNGTKNGVIQTVEVPLCGKFGELTFDNDKVLNIIDALENCLSKEVIRIVHYQNAYLSRA